MRRTLAGLLLLAFTVCLSAAFADPPADPPEPPVRLKRKAKPPVEPPPAEKKADPVPAKKDEPPKKEETPKAPDAAKKPQSPTPPGDKKVEPRKDGEPEGGAEANAARLAEEAQETMARVSKNMQTSEDRLGKRNPGDATQQIQRDIVQDLNKLIELNKQRQQQQQQQQSSSSSAQQQRQQARMRRNQRNQQANQRPQQQPEPQDQQTNKPQMGGGRGGKDDKNSIADLYKDIWGHLPETMRLEMDQYARERFMSRYSELLKQYYTTIAEKGRRKE